MELKKINETFTRFLKEYIDSDEKFILNAQHNKDTDEWYQETNGDPYVLCQKGDELMASGNYGYVELIELGEYDDETLHTWGERVGDGPDDEEDWDDEEDEDEE